MFLSVGNTRHFDTERQDCWRQTLPLSGSAVPDLPDGNVTDVVAKHFLCAEVLVMTQSSNRQQTFVLRAPGRNLHHCSRQAFSTQEFHKKPAESTSGDIHLLVNVTRARLQQCFRDYRSSADSQILDNLVDHFDVLQAFLLTSTVGVKRLRYAEVLFQPRTMSSQTETSSLLVPNASVPTHARRADDRAPSLKLGFFVLAVLTFWSVYRAML